MNYIPELMGKPLMKETQENKGRTKEAGQLECHTRKTRAGVVEEMTWGPGIWVQPSWVLPVKDFSWDFSHTIGQGCSPIWRLNWWRIHFQSHTHDCWQNLVPEQLAVKGLSSLLPVSWRPPKVPWYRSLFKGQHNMAIHFPQSKKAKERPWNRSHSLFAT